MDGSIFGARRKDEEWICMKEWIDEKVGRRIVMNEWRNAWRKYVDG